MAVAPHLKFISPKNTTKLPYLTGRARQLASRYEALAKISCHFFATAFPEQNLSASPTRTSSTYFEIGPLKGKTLYHNNWAISAEGIALPNPTVQCVFTVEIKTKHGQTSPKTKARKQPVHFRPLLKRTAHIHPLVAQPLAPLHKDLPLLQGSKKE